MDDDAIAVEPSKETVEQLAFEISASDGPSAVNTSVAEALGDSEAGQKMEAEDTSPAAILDTPRPPTPPQPSPPPAAELSTETEPSADATALREVTPPLPKLQTLNTVPRTESQALILQPTPIERPETPMDISEAIQQEQSSNASPTPFTAMSAEGKQLNVTDALGYLDKVKVQFRDQPDVYNSFLDIMKEFKSQVIDTPGVIARVSELFTGRPALIEGFNTFLPQGYHIECSQVPGTNANYITVTTPSGTTRTTQTTERPYPTSPIANVQSYREIRRQERERDRERERSHREREGRSESSRQQRQEREQPLISTTSVAFVQKIKARCGPEVYTKFTELLNRYFNVPEEEKDKDELMRRVLRLFKHDPDLIVEFNNFIASDIGETSARAEWIGDDHNDSGVMESRVRLERNESNSVSRTRKRGRIVEKERERRDSAVSSKTKKVSRHADAASTSHHSHSRHHREQVSSPAPRRQAPPQPQRPNAPPPAPQKPSHSTFFERVKRSLHPKEQYAEFLKLVNLFTQGIIDVACLVKESRSYLGESGELLKTFMEILGWDEKSEWMNQAAVAGNAAVLGTRPAIIGGGNSERAREWAEQAARQPMPGRVDLGATYGSYRKLPPSEANVLCSGRDEMCRSVLNDEWVLHPTWTSEEELPFNTPYKNNPFQEALHRSEEERHEYDFHIEAIVRTIAMLEPINNKISLLIEQERNEFKLKPNLGGPAKSIHHRVIKKIYGREAGQEVIQSMQETPAAAIPMVLNRLKLKEDEWKRAQREWNKVWRELDARNYLKSLDSQGLTVRAVDKRTMTSRSLVSQIETAREEQMRANACFVDPLFRRTRPKHQLEFVVEDEGVLRDVVKLVFTYLDRTQGQVAYGDRRRMEMFLRSFVPLFFMLDSVAFNASFAGPNVNGAGAGQQEGTAGNNGDSEMSDALSAAGDDDAASIVSASKGGGGGSGKGKKGVNAGDLRKKLLKSEQAKSSGRKTRGDQKTPSGSRFASPAPQFVMDIEQRKDLSSRKKNVFFTNTAFYTLLRLIEMLYNRLMIFKEASATMVAGQNEALQHRQQQLRASDASENGNENGAGSALAAEVLQMPQDQFYVELLESLEKLFDGQIEQMLFEDHTRAIFGIRDAYKIFTADKIIANILRQIQLIFGDAKSQDLLENLKRRGSGSAKDLTHARQAAEETLGPDENLFKVDWIVESKLMTVQLIGKDDSTNDDTEVLNERWQGYMASYVSDEHTSGVPLDRLQRSFLRRNLPKKLPSDLSNEIIVGEGLEIKICTRTYRLFYKATHTKDYLCRTSPIPAGLHGEEARTTRREKWLQDMRADRNL